MSLNEFNWNIDQKTLLKWKNATNGELFCSKKFNMCDASWYIQIYPNGVELDCKGTVSLFLKCAKLNQYKTRIDVKHSFEFVELKENGNLTYSFTESQQRCGRAKLFPIKKLNHINTLTIKYKIDFNTKIIDNNNIINNKFIWKINNK